MKWAKNVARMGNIKGVYMVSVGRTDGERLLGRPRPRREDVIKMDFQEIEWGIGTELLWQVQASVACECDNETSGSIICGEVLAQMKVLLASQIVICSSAFVIRCRVLLVS